MHNYGLLMGAALVMSACTGVIGSDKLAEEPRQVDSFTRISVASGIGLDAKVGEAISVVVSGDDNIVPLIETKVEEGELKIRVDDNLGMIPRKPLLVRVTVPELQALTASGGSKVNATGIDATEFAVSASGGSQMTLTGRDDALQVDASGGSKLFLQEFGSQTAKVSASGGSEVKVKALRSANVDASGGSRVTVLGGGAIRSNTSGGSEVKAE